MYRKLIALSLVLAFATVFATVGSADKLARKKKASSLAAMMPASDALVTFDADRFFNEGLPEILASNQPLYNDIVGKIDQIQKNTGMDVRQLDELAVSMSLRSAAKGQLDYDPLMLARGRFNSDVIVALVGLMSSGRYRQETIAGRVVYIFEPSKIDPTSIPKTNDTMTQVLDMLLAGLDREMALTAYDSGTLAVGATERVRDLLEGETKISEEMLGPVTLNPKAILTVAAKMPTGLDQFIDVGRDNLGKTLSGIRFLSGAMDVNDGDASVSLNARMDSVNQAVDMKNLLIGLQGFFGGMMAGGKNKDQQVLGRTLKGIKITTTGPRVTMAMTLPQRDIALLVGSR